MFWQAVYDFFSDVTLSPMDRPNGYIVTPQTRVRIDQNTTVFSHKMQPIFLVQHFLGILVAQVLNNLFMILGAMTEAE